MALTGSRTDGDIGRVDALLRMVAEQDGVREQVAAALLGTGPGHQRRSAAVRAALLSAELLLDDATIEDEPVEPEELADVDMDYYRRSRL